MRRYRVQWTDTAKADLREIVGFVRADRPLAARRLLQRIRAAARSLYRFPSRGRFVPELGEVAPGVYRELIVAPYRITFRVEEGAAIVHVTGVFDSRRDLESVLIERMLRS